MAASYDSDMYYTQAEEQGKPPAEMEEIDLEERKASTATDAEEKVNKDKRPNAKRNRWIVSVIIGTSLALAGVGVAIGLLTGGKSGAVAGIEYLLDDEDLQTTQNASIGSTDLQTTPACDPTTLQADPGWFDAENGYQYLNTSERLNWTESREECQHLGGDLAHIGIRNLANRSAIITELRGGLGTGVYLGLSDREEEGKFIFIDGVVADDSNTGWATDQPDNLMDREDCVITNSRRFQPNTLNDVDCALEYNAICEKSLDC